MWLRMATTAYQAERDREVTNPDDFRLCTIESCRYLEPLAVLSEECVFGIENLVSGISTDLQSPPLLHSSCQS